MDNCWQDDKNLVCCICADYIRDFDYFMACELCDSRCHPGCSVDDTLDPSSVRWHCNECINFILLFNHISDNAYFMESTNNNLTSCLQKEKIIKPAMLELFTKSHHRPLLDNIDLDPDSNYFLNASNGCEYSSPSHVAHKCHNDAHSFSIMHLNSRSLLPKLNGIQLLLHQLPATICAISETLLTDSMSDTTGIPGYKFLHKSRVGGIRGGVGMFIREGIEFHAFSLPADVASDAYESLFISLPNTKDPDMINGTIYKPPGLSPNTFNADLEKLLYFVTEAKNVNRNIFLTGDFNIDLLSKLNHASTNDFIDCMIAHHLLPMILQPTRITPTTATLIDNYTFTNSISCITESAILNF